MACIGYNILEIFSANCSHPHGLKFGGFAFYLSFFFFFFNSWNWSLRKRGTEMPQDDSKQTDDSESRQIRQISTQLTFLLSR